MLETSLYRLVEDAHPVESRSNDATAPSMRNSRHCCDLRVAPTAERGERVRGEDGAGAERGRARRAGDGRPAAASDLAVFAIDDRFDGGAEARFLRKEPKRVLDRGELGVERDRRAGAERDEHVLLGDPGELERQPAHVGTENVLQHLFVESEDAVEDEGVVELALGNGLAERAEGQQRRGVAALGGEGIFKRRDWDARVALAVDDDTMRGYGSERASEERRIR